MAGRMYVKVTDLLTEEVLWDCEGEEEDARNTALLFAMTFMRNESVEVELIEAESRRVLLRAVCHRGQRWRAVSETLILSCRTEQEARDVALLLHGASHAEEVWDDDAETFEEVA